MIVTGAFNILLRPLTRDAFRDEYSDLPEEYSTFLKTGTQTTPYVEATQMGGLPRMVKRGEVEPITYVDPEMGPKVEFVDDEYALGFQVSRKMIEDDQFGRIRNNSQWLGRSARLTQEYLGAAFLDDAFTGNIYRGIDGEPLISANHDFISIGGTWSNYLGSVQLGVASMQAAFEMAAQQKDVDGNPYPWMPNQLVVGFADEWMAIQLSENKDEPFTSDRNVNALRKKMNGFSYAVSHYRNNTNSWFLRDPARSDAHFLFRVRPQFEDTFDFDNKAAKYSGRQRINVYFASPRGWIGADPA